MAPAGAFAIDVAPRGEWATVEVLRGDVAATVLAATGDAEASGAVSLVVAELAENAVKYGRFDANESSYRVVVEGDSTGALVRVESPIESAVAAEPLFATLAWLRDFDSPSAAYHARVVELASHSGVHDEAPSRLGLVRLAHEAGCALDAEVRGARIAITARLRFRQKSAG